MVSTRGIGIAIILLNKDIEFKAFPKRDISKCPAIRLAVNRTHNVIGRMIFLTNSIITINIIKAEGVPCGTKCESI